MKRSKPIVGTVAAVITLSLVAAAWAHPAATQSAPSGEIKALISQLSSPDQATRDAAREKLVGMGEEARVALVASARAKAAAETTLTRIDTNGATRPTLVTLDMKEATPQAIFAEIAKQTHYDIRPYEEDDWNPVNQRKISLRADHQPFWEVFRTACNQTGMYLTDLTDPRRILRLSHSHEAGKLMKYPASISGPFLFAISTVSHMNEVDLSDPHTIQRYLQVTLIVLVEPKVKVAQYAYEPEIDEAVDNKGNSLKRNDEQAQGTNASQGLLWTLTVPLQYPRNPGDKIVSLRGRLRVLVPTHTKIVEIPNILKARNISKSGGDIKLTVQNATRLPDRRYLVNLVFSPGHTDDRTFYQKVVTPVIHLVEANGNVLTYNGDNGAGGENGTYHVKLAFYPNVNSEKSDKPAKLVWEVPTAIQPINVPFQFNDLLLP